eukprot:10058106-Karenia_brevis.AAC.1
MSGTSNSLSEHECLKPWVEWLKRSTAISLELAQKHGVRDWVIDQRCRQWQLAGHTARRYD